jgi:16S rRNA (cytosine967-C5)-methyltransferase
MQTKDARQTASELLYQVIYEGQFSNKLIQTAVDQSNMSDVDKRFVRTLIYGVLEKSMTLDWWLGQLSSIKLKKIEPRTQIIIKMAMYQIAFMDKVPNSAAVDEGVKMTKRANFRSAGFVNAVLRSFIRLNGDWPYPNRDEDLKQYLSVYYSHPLWLVERWIELFGDAATEELLIANNEIPQISVRCNTIKTNKKELIREFEKSGYVVKSHDLLPEALILVKMGDVSLHMMDAFRKGHFFIQDLSAMLVGHVVAPKPGEMILDLCAAPGGKSTHMAELMSNSGQIIARDVNNFKLRQIEENINRMSISCVKLEMGDALVVNESDLEKYDKVILDAPCSGLGIIRRKPEIRYNRSMEDIESLSTLQKEMIEVASKYVKKGGELVYSTCTIDPKENDEVLEWFLETHSEYELMALPKKLETLSTDGHKLKLYQSTNGFDGFYIVKLYHSK